MVRNHYKDNFSSSLFHHHQIMASSSFRALALFTTFISLSTIATSTSISAHENFLLCLNSDPSTSIPLYKPNTTAFTSIWEFSIRNLRFSTSSTPKPLLIVTPLNYAHVQATVICSRRNGLQLKVRSGGHDSEGVSYTSDVPFVMLDLINLAEIDVDVKAGTAWVQTGATVGQLCYRISEKSSTYGFPAGVGPTVGVGGQFSGGGYGPLMRKYGLSADNIIDAWIVNVDGKILNRKTMGEDLFWAIRGGGGVSFGVILSWKIKLVRVPATVTIFRLYKTLEQNATALFHRWQSVAYRVPKDLFLQVVADVVNTAVEGERTIQVTFRSMYLGTPENMMSTMNKYFPELGLKREDCNVTSWIQSVLFFSGIPVTDPADVLLNRTPTGLVFYKSKSDYFERPMSVEGLEGVWSLMLEGDMPQLLITPYGGRMSEISSSALPFPHRRGNIYKILQISYWVGEDPVAEARHISWVRRMYSYLTPYVTSSPRTAYLNYRDIDLGQSVNGTATYSEAKAWGDVYYEKNYDRLVKIKTKVDPGNFFRNEQSIPVSGSRRMDVSDNDLVAAE